MVKLVKLQLVNYDPTLLIEFSNNGKVLRCDGWELCGTYNKGEIKLNLDSMKRHGAFMLIESICTVIHELLHYLGEQVFTNRSLFNSCLDEGNITVSPFDWWFDLIHGLKGWLYCFWLRCKLFKAPYAKYEINKPGCIGYEIIYKNEQLIIGVDKK